jgi:uridine kinase
LDCSEAIALIEQAARRCLPVVVGIDGRSGAGKSTFAVALAAASRARLIEGDAFYAGGLELRSDTAEQRAHACIDRPKLRGVLESLRSGRDHVPIIRLGRL